MGPRPAAALPSPLPWLITLVSLFASVSWAYNLPSNTSDYVPSCAQECFASFLETSYADSGCGSSLQCLCSQVGAAGYTMGEGALQCIVAERSIGYCSDTEASNDVVQSAYSMCDDQEDAVEPTHTVITATLVIPTSGGVVSFPLVTTTKTYTTIPTTFATQITTTTTTTSSGDTTTERTTTTTTNMNLSTVTTKSETPSITLSSFTTLPTTLVMETSSAPPFPTTSSSSSTTTRSHSSTETLELDESSTYDPMSSTITLEPTTSTSSAAGETTSAEGAAAGGGTSKDTADDDKDDGLSQKQVAGISIGVLAAAGAAIGAIVIARRMRKKRRYPEMKSAGFLPIRDTWGYKPDPSTSAGSSSWHPSGDGGGGIGHGGHGGGGGRGGGKRRSMNPFPPRPAPAPALNADMLSPNTIGLAISPGNSRAPSQIQTQSSTPSRRMSRLLPAKPVLPVLPLNVPGNRSPTRPESQWPRVSEQVQPTRQSRPPQLPPLHIGPAASSSSSVGKSQPQPPVPKIQIPNPHLPTAEQMRNMRESSATEFEEDAGRASMSPGTQVWRPPASPVAGNANTYYVADEHGNWKLGDPKHASRMSAHSAQGPPPPPPPKDSMYVPSTSEEEEASSNTHAGSSSTAPSSSPSSGSSPPKRVLAPAAPAAPIAAPAAAPVAVAPEVLPDRSLSSRSLSARSQKPMGPRAQPLSPAPVVVVTAPSVSSIQVNDQLRRHSSRRRSMTRNLTTRSNRTSATSDCTTISTSSDGTVIDPSPSMDMMEVDQQQQQQQQQPPSLSPVQESPHSHRSQKHPTIPPKDPRRSSVPTLAALRALQEIDPNHRRASLRANGRRASGGRKPSSSVAAAAAAPLLPPAKPIIYYPPGQPSPTLGIGQPPPGPIRPSRSASAGSGSGGWNPKPPRKVMLNPGLERTGSPTMRIVDPSPSPEEEHQEQFSADKENQNQSQHQSARAPPFFFAPDYPQPLNPRVSSSASQQQQQQQRRHRYSNSTPQYAPSVRPLPQPPYRPPHSQPPYRPPHSQPLAQPQPDRHSQRAHEHHWHPLRAAGAPPQAPLHHQQQHQQQPAPPPPAHTHTYTQSQPTNPNPGLPPQRNPSLLAKRLGSERAAQLSIPTTDANSSRRTPWTRGGGDDRSYQVRVPPLPPVDARGNNNSNSRRHSGPTPWVPTLTPTRRGQDLFLNVQ